jgi:hypothetical protein
VYLARLFGSDAIKIGLQPLTSEDLLYQVKVCKSVGVTPVLVASSLRQLRVAAELLEKYDVLLSIDDRDVVTTCPSEGPHRAAAWLRDPQVSAALARAREPLVLVEGRDAYSDEDRKALQDVGVIGFFSPLL